MKDRLNLVAVVGLVLGAVLGMAGTMVQDPHVRACCWAIDAVGLVVATSLLAMRYFRKGNDAIAAGFLVYAIGESVMLIGTPMSLAASVPSFGAGTALWAAALLMISVPKGFAVWVRAVGVVAGVLFGITSARIFAGVEVLPTAAPLPMYAYPFLVLTFAGWIWTLVRAE
ncbi:MAG: hypothetical protein WB439_07905 [Acidobacteriaceae bacterium]